MITILYIIVCIAWAKMITQTWREKEPNVAISKLIMLFIFSAVFCPLIMVYSTIVTNAKVYKHDKDSDC